MMDDVTIRLRLFAGGWEASAFNEYGQKRKAVCLHWLQAVQELLILLDAQEAKTDNLQPDQFVVPQWVKDCINELIWHNDYIADPAGSAAQGQLTRLLTKTIFTEAHGIFSSIPVIRFRSVNLKELVPVDFSDLPLTASTFKKTLIQRCQRVGQAIMDAERVKPIDPDEGLMSMDEVEKLLADVEFVDNEVLDKLGRIYGKETSALFTGATSPNFDGVFTNFGGPWTFNVNYVLFTVRFDYKLSDLTPAEQRQEILGRIRQVRQARAKALQEAASK